MHFLFTLHFHCYCVRNLSHCFLPLKDSHPRRQSPEFQLPPGASVVKAGGVLDDENVGGAANYRRVVFPAEPGEEGFRSGIADHLIEFNVIGVAGVGGTDVENCREKSE